MEKISRESFIRLGAALGVGAASASVAACGGGGGSGSSGSGGSGGESPSGEGAASTPAAAEETAVTGGAAIAREADVAPGNAVEFKDGGEDAVLVHLEDGEFVAYSAVCTHAGCTVAYRDNQLACPCHGSIFDPANGAEVVTGPAQTPLPEIQVEVRDGRVVKA